METQFYCAMDYRLPHFLKKYGSFTIAVLSCRLERTDVARVRKVRHARGKEQEGEVEGVVSRLAY